MMSILAFIIRMKIKWKHNKQTEGLPLSAELHTWINLVVVQSIHLHVLVAKYKKRTYIETDSIPHARVLAECTGHEEKVVFWLRWGWLVKIDLFQWLAGLSQFLAHTDGCLIFRVEQIVSVLSLGKIMSREARMDNVTVF